jgi:hypothetical protein
MMLDMQNDLAVGQKEHEEDLSWGEPPPDGPEAAHNGGRRDGGGGSDTIDAPTRDAKRDLRNAWQVLAGAVLIPLGVIFIMLGWYGAAHARVVQQQIPYLVSGSFVGLGCMVIGGLLFWGHWLYRMYDQAALHHEEQQRLLEIIAAGVTGQTAWRSGGDTSAVPSVAPGSDVGGPGMYYATTTGTVYHRADCTVIGHHPDDLRVLGPDRLAGMRPCQICSPD